MTEQDENVTESAEPVATEQPAMPSAPAPSVAAAPIVQAEDVAATPESEPAAPMAQAEEVAAAPDPEPAAPIAPAEEVAAPEPAPAPPVVEAAEMVTAEQERPHDGDPRHELRQLMELAIKYPAIGPPLAELAFKIGQSAIGERIVKMGLDDDASTGVEFYAVAVDVARREGRYEEVFAQVEDALQTFTQTEDDAVSEDEANRLLHLVRSSFAVLLFDLEDVNAKPEWVRRLAAQLPRLEARFANDPFYYSLLAQALWFTDKEASEKTWEKAVALSDGEFAWNARGTWYKDAAQDFNAAQAAYRTGLEKLRDSALLLHNLAQLLTDEAAKGAADQVDNARQWLREADDLVRQALRKDARKGLRRYIHGTKERIRKLTSQLPAEEVEPPAMGDVLKGRVVAVVQYGCFVTVRGGIKGLLHKTELAWERVNDPNELVKVGDEIQVKVVSVEPQEDGTVRVGFSRKALLKEPENLPKPERRPAPDRGDKKEGEGRSRRGQGRRGGSKKPAEGAATPADGAAATPADGAAKPREGGGRSAEGQGRGRGGRSGGGKPSGSGGKGGGRSGGGSRGGKGGGGSRGHRDDTKREDGMGSLGELLLAKLEAATKASGSDSSEDS